MELYVANYLQNIFHILLAYLNMARLAET